MTTPKTCNVLRSGAVMAALVFSVIGFSVPASGQG